MKELLSVVDEETKEPVTKSIISQGVFSYDSGYLLKCSDLGIYNGVKFQLSHPQGLEEPAAILLPPAEVEKLARWLMKSMGQLVPHLPNKLPEILKRINKTKGDAVTLERGDRAAIKQSVLIYKAYQEIQGDESQ